MQNFVAFQDEESRLWQLSRHGMPRREKTLYYPSGRKKGTIKEERPFYEWEKPENLSVFVSAHKIIEANSWKEAEEICRTLNSM